MSAVCAPPGRRADRLVLDLELVDHAGELGDVGLVAGVGVPGQRDPAVPGDDQPEPDQPQVRPLLLGFPALRDRRLAVGGGDEGGEVGHVQRHARHVRPRDLHDPCRDLPGGLLQLLQGDGVHRVPEPAVIQRGGADLGEPVRRGGPPPVRELRFRARGDQPVQRRQRQVGPGGQRLPGRARPRCLVDDRDHAELLKHAPGRGHVPERQVPGPLWQHGCLAALHRGGDLRGGAQVPFGDHFRLAVHAGHLPQVPVRLPADLLRVQARHNIRSYSIQRPKSST